MKEFQYTITDPVGIHARPAGLLKVEAKKFASSVQVIKGDASCEAVKTLKLMGLGIVKGDTITVRIEGEDEEACAAAIEEFFRNNF